MFLSLWFQSMPRTLKRCCINVLPFYDLKVGDDQYLLVMVYLHLYYYEEMKMSYLYVPQKV